MSLCNFSYPPLLCSLIFLEFYLKFSVGFLALPFCITSQELLWGFLGNQSLFQSSLKGKVEAAAVGRTGVRQE